MQTKLKDMQEESSWHQGNNKGIPRSMRPVTREASHESEQTKSTQAPKSQPSHIKQSSFRPVSKKAINQENTGCNVVDKDRPHKRISTARAIQMAVDCRDGR